MMLTGGRSAGRRGRQLPPLNRGKQVEVMALGLLGTKVGMTQIYDEEGKIAPVTVLQVGPCPILLVRSQEKDGYHAVQVGYQDKKRERATRAERGHVSARLESKTRQENIKKGKIPPPKAECEPQRYIQEFRLDAPREDLRVGTVLTADDVFKETKAVDVIGTSKGRGTAGPMKRHNFKGLRTSHGVKKGSRQRGSIASNASNRGSGRPKKGIRMAGRYGASRVTVRNLRVVKIDPQNNLILVMGAVPGPNGGLITIRPTNKVKSTHGKKPQQQAPSAAKKAAAAKKK
jgi:large subunit ribosomal protein L3